MNFVIEQKGVKRIIEGDFLICANREDLEFLGKKLLDQTEKRNWTYGWIEIREPLEHKCINSNPKKWTE